MKNKNGRFPTLLVACVVCALMAIAGYYIYANHTYIWFNMDLPSPDAVAAWPEQQRDDALFRLSHWDGFRSGKQFAQFVRRELAPLGLNASDRFHFLEVGMGVGAFARVVLRDFPHATGVGIDIVPATVEIARIVLPRGRMDVHVADMTHIPSPPARFDAVLVPGALCLLFSMDHVRRAVAEFHRVLKPGGGACVSLLPSDAPSAYVGACNVRVPQAFWLDEVAPRYDFTVLAVEDMDGWHLPHSMGRYSVCLRKKI